LVFFSIWGKLKATLSINPTNQQARILMGAALPARRLLQLALVVVVVMLVLARCGCSARIAKASAAAWTAAWTAAAGSIRRRWGPASGGGGCCFIPNPLALGLQSNSFSFSSSSRQQQQQQQHKGEPLAMGRGGGGGRGEGGGKLSKGKKKGDLPEKTCVVCGRPFTWRAKWAKVRLIELIDRCDG
jgi:hypothetical protein